jgi:hypothetical protein
MNKEKGKAYYHKDIQNAVREMCEARKINNGKVYVVVNLSRFHHSIVEMYDDAEKAVERAGKEWSSDNKVMLRTDVYSGTAVYELCMNTEKPYSAVYWQKDLSHKEDLEEWLQELDDTIAHSIAVRPLDYWNRSLIKEKFGNKEGATKDMEIYEQLMKIIQENRIQNNSQTE